MRTRREAFAGPGREVGRRATLPWLGAARDDGRRAMALPAGTVTLLFSDIEGSTRLLERLGDGYDDLLEEHRRIVRRALGRHGGHEVRTEGDAFFVAFARAGDAVRAAVAAQRGLAESEWPRGGTVRVRMGVHTGEPRVVSGDYIGLDVHCAARICSAAHGGQVVVSEATERVLAAQPVEGVSMHGLGVCRLKDLSRPVGLYQVRAERLVENFPPLRALERPPSRATEVARQRAIFVGRDRELAELLAALDDLPSRGGALFLLSGEPGIGKTRLVEEFAARAADRGARVLSGRCWESGGAPAYWPWVQCLRALIQEAEPGLLAAQLGAGAADIAQIVPKLREFFSDLPLPPSLDPEGARFRLFDAVTTFLRNAAAAQPLVVVLEDVQAADAASLLLLRFVAADLAQAHLLVIATRRDSDRASTDTFASALAELTRTDRFHDLPLAGLGREDVARLVKADSATEPTEGLVAAIHDRTEGHPFFVGETVRMLASGGRLDALPLGVRAVVAQRLGLLSEKCRRVLAVAAVVGREFETDLLAVVAEVEPAPLLDRLEEALVAKALADVPGAPGRFRFAHALIREVLYDELAATRRLRLHGRVGEALEAIHAAELEPRLAELAHHFLLAAPAGSAAKAVDYAARAAERAVAELAYEEAARLYEMAVMAHGLQPGADAPVRCELLLGLGAAQASAGDMIAAKDTFVRAADVARSAGMAEQLARAALGLGGSHVTLPPDDARVLPLLEEALAAVGENGGVLRARLLARLACAAQRPSLSLDGVDLARRLDDPATLAWTLHARFVFVWGPDNLDDLFALSGEMIAAAERAEDPEQALNGHLLRFELLVTLGRTAAARDELAVATRLARELRLPSARWHVAVHEAELALLGGRFAEADALIEQAQQSGERSASAAVTATPVVQRFPLLLEQRRLEELRPALSDIAAANPQTAVYRCLLARLEVDVGNYTAARAMLELLAPDDWAAVPRDYKWLLAVSLLAETAALLTNEEWASQLYDLLAPYASLVAVAPHFFPIGAVSRYLGMLAAVLSNLDEAARRLEDAAATNSAIGARPWVAHAKADHARVLLTRNGSGDREHACDLLRDARATYQQLAMTASAAKVSILLEQARARTAS
jgi:class 3 adenylate cyclase